MRPKKSATSDAENAPKKQRKVTILQEKTELFEIHHSLRSAGVSPHHFRINKYSIRITEKKEKETHEAITAGTPACVKPSTFCKISFHLVLKMQLSCMQDCYNKGIPIDSNMIQEMMKSLYNNLKQKDYERSKAEAFHASKGWFDNFRKSFGFEKKKKS